MTHRAEAVTALAFSLTAAPSPSPGTPPALQLRDVSGFQPLGGPLLTLGERIDSLGFSPDGGTLYAVSGHVPLQRYVITSQHAVSRVCARAGGGLTRAQWRTYVPDAGYREIR